MEYFIGTDIGTTSVKAVAFAPDGRQLGREAEAYPLISLKADFQEQNPEVVLKATLKVIKELRAKLAGEVIAISFSSAMHSLIALDNRGNPLSRMITWADRRAKKIVADLEGTKETWERYRLTGVPIHPLAPLYKIRWIKEQQPEIFSRTSRFIDIKSYILFHLIGKYVCDYSIASSYGLFDLLAKKWDSSSLSFAGISEDQLPELVPTEEVFIGMIPEVSSYLDIKAETPIIAGASDGCLANLGAMALEPGEEVITIGTSGAIRKTLPAPVFDDEGRLFSYWLSNDYYVSGGATNNGGILLDWYRNTFSSDLDARQLLISVKNVKPGADGLLFLPYIYGERAPVWGAEAKGVFLGISSRHSPSHFARAILEGCLFNIYLIGNALERLTPETSQIYANGGFTRSEIWVQMLADIFGKPVIIRGHQEGSAFGAALMAMKSLKWINDYQEMASVIQEEAIFEPDKKIHDRYREIVKRFEEVYKVVCSL